MYVCCCLFVREALSVIVVLYVFKSGIMFTYVLCIFSYFILLLHYYRCTYKKSRLTVNEEIRQEAQGEGVCNDRNCLRLHVDAFHPRKLEKVFNSSTSSTIQEKLYNKMKDEGMSCFQLYHMHEKEIKSMLVRKLETKAKTKGRNLNIDNVLSFLIRKSKSNPKKKKKKKAGNGGRARVPEGKEEDEKDEEKMDVVTDGGVTELISARRRSSRLGGGGGV